MTTERIRKIRARWPDKVPCIVVYKKHEAKFIHVSLTIFDYI